MAKKYLAKEEEIKSPSAGNSYRKSGDKFKVRVHDSCIAIDDATITYSITTVFGYDEDGNEHIYSNGIFIEGYQMMAEFKEDGTVEVSEIREDERDTTTN